jgi:hypothetical protein
MSHLGDRVSSLVDGQLEIGAAERALSHIAGCRECREAVEIERLMKQRLASLNRPDPACDLVHRLMDLSGPAGPLPPRPGHVPGTPRPSLITTNAAFLIEPSRGSTAGLRPPGRRGSSRPPVSLRSGRGGVNGLSRMARVTRSSRNRVAAAMVGAVCLVGAGVAGGVASGAGIATARVVPPVDSFVVEHMETTRNLPLSDLSDQTDQSVMWGFVGSGR